MSTYLTPTPPGSPQIKVTRITQNTFVDERGNLQRQVVVNYMVGDHGPFTEVFPAVNFDPSKVMSTLQAQAAAISQVAMLGS